MLRPLRGGEFTFYMPNVLHFEGYIPAVSYSAKLIERLSSYDLGEFDINAARPYGLIETGYDSIAFSRWVSPKRTRSYPFERIYNTYHAQKMLTVIPVIKDEGRDGDLDRIQFSTVSWMSLVNVYIVLAYYERARKNTSTSQAHRQKLTGQTFDNEFVKAQIREIIDFKQSALHWNINLFEHRFAGIFERGLDAYRKISRETGIEVHDQAPLFKYLRRIRAEYDEFRNISLEASSRASGREVLTTHRFELLEDGAKATFHIKNYLGGVYYLTADEVIVEDGRYVIQESKHASRGSLPSVADIKDGLFKLILFTNLKSLSLAGEMVRFSSRLKLTGARLHGSVRLPALRGEEEEFIALNKTVLTKRQQEIVRLLQLEASGNNNLEILIKGGGGGDNVSSPLRYPGGKSKAVDQIVNHLPDEFAEYREPFVGGGSLFLHLRQAYPRLPIWINDLNADLICFWRCAQTSLGGLAAEVSRIKNTVHDGRALFEDLARNYEADLSEMERAVRFFVLNRITFSGTVDSGGYSQKAFETRFTFSSIERLSALEGLLSGVRITNLDYDEVLRALGDDCFIYCDPPYLNATKSRLYGRRGSLHAAFDHERFAENLKHCSHKWLITYDDSAMVRRNFDFACVYGWELQYGMNNFTRPLAAKGKELFIANYEADVHERRAKRALASDPLVESRHA